MNSLTIQHRGERRRFLMTKGGYSVSDDFITFSVETRAEDGQSPYAALLSLVNFPRRGLDLVPGAVFSYCDSHSSGWDDESTHANAYFDFHVENIELCFEIVDVDVDVLTVRVSALTDEYGYDDSGHNPQAITGTFRMGPKSKSKLWIPS